MFQRSSNIVVTGGTFVHHTGTTRVGVAGLEKLQNASAPNALYNSSARFDPPKCHHNTRLAVLNYIYKWIYGLDHTDTPVLWLYGPAGSGKSAILQTISEKCDGVCLLATFFFSASDSTRNHATQLIPTIAYQIATKLPKAKSRLENIIDNDPMIFHKSIDAQIRWLVVEPIKDINWEVLFNDKRHSPRLILIDGLDECGDQDIRRVILHALSRVFREYRIPLLLLISSRPEQDITAAFNSSHMLGLWNSLVLDDSFLPDQDIRLFLKDSFEEIKATHPRKAIIPAHWPGLITINELVKRSSGQFIYASVAIKYISAISDLPPRQLDIILGLRPPRREAPFSELDALYTCLMSPIPSPDITLSILAMVIVDHHMFTNFNGTTNIARLLELEDGDVELALGPLSCIIAVGPGALWYEGNLEVNLSHASFTDFLLDQSRSHIFHINLDSYYNTFSSQAIKYLNAVQSYSAHGVEMDKEPLQVENMLHLLVKLLPKVDQTDDLYHQLNHLQLQRLWSRFPSLRSTEIPALMYRFATIPYRDRRPSNAKYKQLYGRHLQSLEPLLRTEIIKYLEDTSLTSVLITCWLMYRADGRVPIKSQCHAEWRDIAELLQIDEHTVEMDRNGSFDFLGQHASCSGILTDFLFLRTTPNCIRFKDDQFPAVALRLLAYLCLLIKRPYNVRQKVNYLAKLAVRSARHRRAARMQLGVPAYPTKKEITFLPCQIGLKLLCLVLQNCDYSEELTIYIRTHIKNLVIIPRLTRKALEAISKYLSRSRNDMDVDYVLFKSGDFVNTLKWLDTPRYL